MPFKIGKISYINSVPLFCAGSDFETVEDCPARLNALAKERALDISLVSRWIYGEIASDYEIIPQFCIAGAGEIMSVEIFSKRPLSELEGGSIFITSETGTAVRAFSYLAKKNCGLDIRALRRAPLESADAALLIGNSALAFCGGGYPYKYDLGSMWKESEGVKMVYAVAVARRDVYAKARAAAEDYFEKSLAKFSAEKKEIISRVAAGFKLSQGREISEERLSKYYEGLLYKLPESEFDEAFERVEKILENEPA